MTRVLRMFSWWLLLLALAMLPGFVVAQTVTGQELVSSVRSGRTTFDYSYRITVRNGDVALNTVQASVQSTSPATQVIKRTVALGNLAAGATLTSTDVFTIRQDRTLPFNPAVLTWTVTGVPVVAGPSSMEISLSEPIVAPDGSISVTPVVRDANGVALDNAAFQFSVSVAPVGNVIGRAPVVDGLNVSFPRLVKRLLNQDTSIDPEGLYADGDPTDPNYGKETGGRYRVTVSLAGSSIVANREVLVLPSGSAATTVQASRYAGGLNDVVAAAARAAEAGNTSGLAEARAALQTLSANTDNSAAVLSATQVLAPANGGLLTPAFLASRGFTADAQDASFITALATVRTRITAARTQVEALNVNAMTQDTLNALQAAAAAYRQALTDLQALRLSALGAAQQQVALNQLLGTELPQLLDAVKRKSGELLAVVSTSSVRGASSWVAASKKAPGLRGPVSPREFYQGTQPVQVYSFAAFAFSIFTDLSGTARANIIELTVTLVNSLVNIMAADAINASGGGDVSIDMCLASSSVAFVCPNYRPSIITGSGFGRDASAVRVALVGCIGGDLIRNLVTLRQPRDIAAGIRLINKVISITNSLQQEGGVGAVVRPDFIDEDELFGGDRLYFANGWPRVNQGRLPCVGIVIVTNTANGGISALNLNFLGQCG
ncbi:hypothetical protein [Piscinibacter sp. HJYY11]|uniref:hypothetical protein n=1 Tax=Piscinibacter sp. HJYY11 TaxID=2801333 RepID=UPI00191DEAAF|nr:hypothetical protein [Piscinibacter sp. HJYY11]MBL0726227.1 hypothetical protein [Piscinibacter sp. HJYY11]